MKSILILLLIITSLCKPAQPVYTVSPDEKELIAEIVWLEAGTCSSECQMAIASVIFNQLEAGYWGHTVVEVVYHTNNYTSAKYLYKAEPNKTTYEAVEYVIQHGTTLPKEVRYFRNDHDFVWDGYVGYCNIDNVYFGYFTNGNH